MSRSRTSRWAAFIAAVVVSGCGGGGEGGGGGGSDGDSTPPPPADPAGTATTDLAFTSPGHCLDFEAGSTIASTGDVCVSGSNLVSLDFNELAYPNGSSRIAGVGAVAGLGAITSVPTAGWVKSAAASLGNGYVVLTREGNAYAMFASAPAPNAYRMKWALLRSELRPASPTLTVTPRAGAASLSWSDVPGATGYVIRFWGPLPVVVGQGNPRPEQPEVIRVATTAYEHTGLASGMAYEYFVFAVFPWGETLAPPYPTGWQRVAIP